MRSVFVRVAWPCSVPLSSAAGGVGRLPPCGVRLLATSTKDLLNEAPIRNSVKQFTDGRYRIVTVNEDECARLDDIVMEKDYTKKIKRDRGSTTQLIEEKGTFDELFAENDANANRIKGFLEMNPYVCHGCGSPFQSKTEDSPGFLPKDKMAEHQEQAEKIRKEQDTIKLLQQAGYHVGSTSATHLLESAKVSKDVITSLNRFTNEEGGGSFGDPKQRTSSSKVLNAREAKELYKNEIEKIGSVAKCQRCFRLQQYGQINESLRAGWSKHELLSPAHFQSVLKSISETNAVVLCLVDVFDLQGSLLANLRDIAGDNPIVIAANKFDLLPKDVYKHRVHGWIYDTVKGHCNLMSPKEAEDMKYKQFESRGWIRPKERNSEEGVLHRKNVHLVSCQTGDGIGELLGNVFKLAEKNGDKIYVMGAANVGKSSFINRLLQFGSNKNNRKGSKSVNKKQVPTTTVSNLPGTTLDMLKIKLRNGITVIDTPGLINEGQLTTLLTPAELNAVVPAKPITAVTLRAEMGKSFLIGAIARIELIEGKPFNFTFFVSNEVKLRPVAAAKADEFVMKHVGNLITPPESLERLQGLGPMVDHEYSVLGEGWERSAVDIVIAGLGWVAITGSGSCRIKISVPGDTLVSRRESLLPFESRSTGVRFTGARFIKKSVKKGHAGKNLGHRAS